MSDIILSILIFVFCHFVQSKSVSEFYDQWPKHCCQLELREMKFGDQLPEDYVFAGTGGVNYGQKFAYVVDRHFSHNVLLKSERFRSYAMNWEGCAPQSAIQTLDVLVNPNKCSLEWYNQTYYMEEFPLDTGHLFPGGEFFAPAYNGRYFASIMNGTWVGAVNTGGWSYGCQLNSPDTADYIGVGAGSRILTVDCLKSLTTMTDTSLLNISFPDLPNLTSNNVTHFKRVFNNNSPSEQKQKVGFSFETRNRVQVSLSESFSSSRCDEKRDTFSSTFSASVMAGAWTNFGFEGNSISATVGTAITNAADSSSKACSAESKNKSSTNVQEERKRYTFNDEITVPANSKTTVDAFSSPIVGTVDYNMTYLIRPRVGNDTSKIVSVIKEGLKYFKLATHIEDNGQDVIVNFPGTVSIDSGYEVTVDVQSVPLKGAANEEKFSLASYNLIPDEK